MSLGILLGLVVVGIAGIAALTVWLGFAARKPLSEDDARADWLRHFPEDTVRSVWISSDAHAALVLSGSGAGLLWAMGSDTAARRLEGARVIDSDTGLKVSFPDFTAPHVDLVLDTDARLVWKRLMEAS